METIVYAEIRTSGCYAALFLNDVPILSTGRLGAVFSSMPVRQVLVRGANRLELLVEPLEEPRRARVEHRRMTLVDKWAVARLVRYPEGVPALVENGELLLEHRWASEGREATYPVSMVGDVVVSDARHVWSWQSAPLLTMSPELVEEATSVVEEVGAAIRRRDLDGLMALTSDKLLDARTAYPARDVARDRAELGALLAYFGAKGDPIVPLTPGRRDFRLVAGGRMLETVDQDGFATLRLRDPRDGEAMPYPLLLARLDGRLRVVR